LSFWNIVEIFLGFACIGLGVLNKEFIPMGWTTWLTWGTGENTFLAVAGPFYVESFLSTLDRWASSSVENVSER